LGASRKKLYDQFSGAETCTTTTTNGTQLRFFMQRQQELNSYRRKHVMRTNVFFFFAGAQTHSTCPLADRLLSERVLHQIQIKLLGVL